ncbi:MAG: hypothetical protein Kow006_28790 [Gammaproteobacteria bacterium]
MTEKTHKPAADSPGVYSVDKLIGEARKLAADYRRATGKPLPGVSAEIAVHDAARLLHLTLTPDAQGYDAIGSGERDGRRIQIKGRVIFDEEKGGQRVGQLKNSEEWDSVMLVLMDEDYEPYEIYEAMREDLLEAQSASNSARAKRGAISVAKFKIIGELVWDRVSGLGGEVWENRPADHTP